MSETESEEQKERDIESMRVTFRKGDTKSHKDNGFLLSVRKDIISAFF